MAQIDYIFADVRCPHCGEEAHELLEVAIAGTGADDGGIADDEGVSDVKCNNCHNQYKVEIQCFPTVRT